MTARLCFPLHAGQNTLSLAGHKEGWQKLIKSAKRFFIFFLIDGHLLSLLKQTDKKV